MFFNVTSIEPTFPLPFSEVTLGFSVPPVTPVSAVQQEGLTPAPLDPLGSEEPPPNRVVEFPPISVEVAVSLVESLESVTINAVPQGIIEEGQRIQSLVVFGSMTLDLYV